MANRDISKTVGETPFEEAKEYFKHFLSSIGVSSDLMWIFREDVIFLYDRIFIRTPIVAGNESRARAVYKLGQTRDLGINLHGFCLLNSRLCCYVGLPEDDLDAQYMMMSNVGVKYNCLTVLPIAESVFSGLIWTIRRWQSSRARFTCFDNHIPSRYSLLSAHRVDIG